MRLCGFVKVEKCTIQKRECNTTHNHEPQCGFHVTPIDLDGLAHNDLHDGYAHEKTWIKHR